MQNGTILTSPASEHPLVRDTDFLFRTQWSIFRKAKGTLSPLLAKDLD